jgi:hypothetical protein
MSSKFILWIVLPSTFYFFVLCFLLCLTLFCVLCPMLSMFLDCPFSIPPSVFSNVNDVVDKNNNDKFDISLVSKYV